MFACFCVFVCDPASRVMKTFSSPPPLILNVLIFIDFVFFKKKSSQERALFKKEKKTHQFKRAQGPKAGALNSSFGAAAKLQISHFFKYV